MRHTKIRLSLLALALTVITFASPSYSQSARNKPSATRTDAARDAATRKCSTLGFRSAKEYNSSAIPWYTYSNCMVEHGQRP
jgi:hypothetical protein